MNNLFGVFIVFFCFLFFSCNNIDRDSRAFCSFSDDNRKIFIDLDLSVARPKDLYSTLKMFNYSTIFLDLKVYCDKTLIGKSPIIRKIKYDRWSDLYLIENSYLYGDIRFKDFDSMFSEIYKFKKIEIETDINLNGYKNKEFSINYDFYLNSMEFLPPFKIIEYNREFDNIKIKNKSCKLYVK